MKKIVACLMPLALCAAAETEKKVPMLSFDKANERLQNKKEQQKKRAFQQKLYEKRMTSHSDPYILGLITYRDNDRLRKLKEEKPEGYNQLRHSQ